MYFGDHIAESVFRTADGQIHESLAVAQDYDRRRFAELKQDDAAARVINGLHISDNGAEIWERVDPARDDLESFDAFIRHYSTTGLNHRTDSIDVAVAFNAAQAKIFDAIDAAEGAARIEQRITDESGVFSVWVPMAEG